MYDRRASNYDDSHHPSFAQNFVEHVPLQPGDKVLDLACGTGLISFLAADKVGPTGAVVGVDISSAMLQVAQKKLSSHVGTNITFHEHDITRLDEIPSLVEQKGTFSAITIASALVLLHDPAEAIASWLPYLKPGGYLVTDVPHPQNWLHMSLIELVARHMKLHFPYHRMWASEENSLRTLLTKAGLEVTSYTFVECVGHHEKAYALEDADEWFAKAVSSIPEVSRLFEDEALYAEAQRLYRGEWAKIAVKDPLGHGRAIDVDGVYVAEEEEEEEAPLTPTPTPSSPLTLPGSCHCGALRFQLNVLAAPVAMPTPSTSSISMTSPAAPTVPLSALTCHCRTCRRISASTSQTYVPVHMSSFHWLSSLNKSYPATPHNGPPALRPRTFDEHAERAFCAVCGAGRLWVAAGAVAEAAEPESAIGGALEEAAKVRVNITVRHHIWLGEKAAWDVLPADGAERWLGDVGGEVWREK
ncbi:S-adenosyl-L-methionine-dependent methyltransferase [Phyllosticta citriasiana]|uniref:S-adenosyl-L-methionine-dependent methyltransferase n=1 Tax=Phyllosticta citriasiana TaxID=595635 RepID=A0ABR1KYM5_9PEZI